MTDTIQTFFTSVGPQQLAFVQSVTSTRDMPSTTTKVESHDMAQYYGHAAVAKSNKQSATVKNAKGKNTRPLNSFMGFRCYYSVLFEDFEQKVISTYIVFLWERDPCKAKWALAAKAYSVIRDQVGKEHAPLDVFLMLVANLLDIVEPQNYLAVMGWEISVDDIGTVTLVKNDAMEIDNRILLTNLSVQDIISYACELGYAGSMGSVAATPNGKPIMAMAASSQHASVKHVENKVKDDQDQTSNAVADEAPSEVANDQPGAATTVTPPNNNLTSASPAAQNTAAVTLAQPTAAQAVPVVAATHSTQSTHPFQIPNILDFDPDVTLPIFEPTEGDAWDAFDITAWIHEDAFAA